MFKQYRTFFNILLLILLSTIIVMVMYTVTYNHSIAKLREDIQVNNLNRIRFLVKSLDQNVEKLTMIATALETDSKVELLPSVHMLEKYDQITLIRELTDKMKLQSFSEGWSNQISIYSSILNQWIGVYSSSTGAPSTDTPGNQWTFDTASRQFKTYRTHPSYVISVAFPLNNMKEMLDRARIGSNDPFFYRSGAPIILNHNSNEDKINQLLEKLAPNLPGRVEGTEVVNIDGIDYMVNFIKSEGLDWYMVDYLPLNEALQPIEKTRNFFYIACIMLFMGGVVTALFLYKKVQIPIIELLRGVRLLKHGDFSHRIEKVSRNEFDLLYKNFNEMAAQIEDLIEKVYKEKIVAREAMVKQLQAQINPHFLYNCLFFINNMTRLGNDEAITAMTQNLAEYFRYTTRLDSPTTTMEKELGIVENYMNIQCLRMERLHYEINIADTMKQLVIPKLLIQPLVENSVIHGIEKKQSARLVRISGIEGNDQYRLIVEDDGRGMTDESIKKLIKRINQPLDDTMGCALWNIGQRMQIYFEKPSGMKIEPSDKGGVRVILYWPKKSHQED